MNSKSRSEEPLASDTWSTDEIEETLATNWFGRIMNWWHKIASPPPLPKNATVTQRERYRRARAVSSILFFFLPAMVLVYPSSLSVPNIYLRYVLIGVIAICLLALLFNRMGQTLLAGIAISLSFEGAVTAAILTTWPLNETALQFYDLYALVELLAIAVLPSLGVWFVAIIDSIFVSLDLWYQPHTAAFGQLILSQQYSTIITRPIAVMLIVASATSLWLASISKATRQSYQAEFVANLEHVAAQQGEIDTLEKQELEASIQQLMQEHANIMNGKQKGQITYPQAKILWPLVNIINTLVGRSQRYQQREQEYTHLEQDLAAYTNFLQQASHIPEQPLPPYYTKTVLSPLTLTVAHLHRELQKRQMSSSQQIQQRDF
jgi:hypothetical protein